MKYTLFFLEIHFELPNISYQKLDNFTIRNELIVENKTNMLLENGNSKKVVRFSSKKIGDIKGIYHARMDMIKDRNCKDVKKQKRLRRNG